MQLFIFMVSSLAGSLLARHSSWVLRLAPSAWICPPLCNVMAYRRHIVPARHPVLRGDVQANGAADGQRQFGHGFKRQVFEPAEDARV